MKDGAFSHHIPCKGLYSVSLKWQIIKNYCKLNQLDNFKAQYDMLLVRANLESQVYFFLPS